MAIQKPNAPEQIAGAFLKQLAEFVWAGENAPLRQAYIGAMPEAPRLEELGTPGDPALPHDAHQLFVLGLTDIAKHADVGAAVSVGWRFFAGNPPGRVLMGTVTRKSKGWTMTAGYYGERVATALLATLALEQLEQAFNADYEVRMLSVPGLNLEAFWLASQSTKWVDLAVPFPAMPNQPIEALNTEPVYTMPNFLAAIRPLAVARLAEETKESQY